ncbi:deoxynucleoside kinase [Halocola ammonii]
MKHKYIAIEGNIGAGKTSLATQIASDFNGKLILEEFADNPFLPKFYENPERYAFPVELSFLAERFSQLKKELTNQDLFHERVVSDYFLSKSIIFSKANLDPDEYDLFVKTYHIMHSSLPHPDLLVYLYLDYDKLKENIQKRGRPYEQNIEEEYLAGIQKSYFEFIRQQQHMPVLIIDTNDVDFVNSHEDYQRMISLLEKDYSKGVHRLKA